jgi:hypothetical protein
MSFALTMILLLHLLSDVYSYEAYPTGVAFLLGYYIVMLAFGLLICVPIIAKNGKFDIFTEVYMRFKPVDELHDLTKATAEAYDSGAGRTSPFGFLKRNKDGVGGGMTKGDEQLLADEKEEDAEDNSEEGVLVEREIAC